MGKAVGQADARRLHGRPVFRADHDARTEPVRHGAAGDVARGGTLQRFDDLAAVRVRQPDVEQQVDVVLRGVDVGHHGVDGCVRVLQQVRPVAADRFKSVDRMPDPKQVRIAFRHVGLQILRVRSGSVGHVRHPREHLTHPRDAAPANVHLAEQDVGHDAHHRHGDNHDDPGDPRRRLAMRPQQHPHAESELNQNVQSREDRRCELGFHHESTPGR